MQNLITFSLLYTDEFFSEYVYNCLINLADKQTNS